MQYEIYKFAIFEYQCYKIISHSILHVSFDDTFERKLQKMYT